MQIIENDKIKEKVYIKKLENCLTIMVIPKIGVQNVGQESYYYRNRYYRYGGDYYGSYKQSKRNNKD